MARFPRVVISVLTLMAVGAVGCSSSAVDDDRAALPAGTTEASTDDVATSSPVAEVDTVEPEPTTTTVPLPLADGEVEAAALEALGASSEAAAWRAWHVLEVRVRIDGRADIDVCVWDGETIANGVRTVQVQVERTISGVPKATVLGDFVGAGTCVSGAMIESALSFVATYEQQWSRVLREPASFDATEWTDLLDERLLGAVEADMAQRVTDGVHVEPATVDGIVYPDDLEAELLWRRATADGGSVLALALCQQTAPDHGLYRGDVLLDANDDDATGTHNINHVELRAAPETDLGWRLVDSEGIVWADCFATGDWPAAVARWKPAPPEWSVWP